MTRVATKIILKERQKPSEPVKEYLDWWQVLALQCHKMEPRTKYDICMWNIEIRFQRNFVSIKPNSFAQIAKIAQSAEVVMRRENKEREFYMQPGKRKEVMMVTSFTRDKKRRVQQSYRSSERVQLRKAESNLTQRTWTGGRTKLKRRCKGNVWWAA